jgi:hypothetical protein
MNKKLHRLIACSTAALALTLAGCAGLIATEQGQQCSEALRTAYQELDLAKVKGFSGTVAWSKAAGLLSAAEMDKQLEKFPGCINKVERARAYIRDSQM